MATVRIEVLSGAEAGRVFEPEGEVVSIGRAPSNDVQLAEPHISGEHARIVLDHNRVLLEDLRSTNGTTIVRSEQRFPVSEGTSLRLGLCSGDIVELGGVGAEATLLRVTLGDDPEPAHIVTVRPLAELSGHTPNPERNTDLLQTLFKVQKAIGAAGDLMGVLTAVADGALDLVPRATHATLVLRDEPDAESGAEAGYVPMLTRVRGGDGQG